MDLKSWLKKNRYRQLHAAELLGVHPRYFNSIVLGERIPGRKLALAIETFTSGEIKASELLGMK